MTAKLIGTSETALLLGISRASVNKRVNDGKLKPAGEIGPRGIRLFNRADIEKLAEAEAVAS